MMAHRARRPTEVALMGLFSGTADLWAGSVVPVVLIAAGAFVFAEALGSDSVEEL